MSNQSKSRNETTPRNQVLGVICGIGVILLFSSFTLVSKIGFASSLRIVDIAAIRFFIAGILMAPVLIHFGLSGVRFRDAFLLTFTGGIGFALLAYSGFSMAPASHGAALLHGTLPLFSAVLAYIFLAKKVGAMRVLGLIGIFLGIVTMAGDSFLRSTTKQLMGDASLLLASICWSGYGLIAQKLRLKPAHSASIVAVFSALCYLPIYAFLPGKSLLLIEWQELWVQALFQGLLIGVGSIFVYSHAVASLGAIETALFTAAVPCITTIAAVFLIPEVPSKSAVIGVATVTLGMAVAIRNWDYKS